MSNLIEFNVGKQYLYMRLLYMVFYLNITAFIFMWEEIRHKDNDNSIR